MALNAIDGGAPVMFWGWRFVVERPDDPAADCASLYDAARAGQCAALALRPGGVFGGAWYWASQAGYAEGTEQRAWFTHAFLMALPADVDVDQDTGTITRIGDWVAGEVE